MVSISVDGAFLCGGSIIGSCWILTAANCLKGSPLNALTVRAGEYDRGAVDGTEQTKTVALKYVHPDYNIFDENDVALLYLPADLSLNAAVITGL